MVYGIYQSAAGLQLNQYQQDVLANNMANLDTPGFKQDLTVVRERQVAAREGFADPSLSDRALERMTGGSLVAPTYTSFEQGPLQKTDQPLDVAISGDGFFAVQNGNYERYTRDGRFTLNDQGELVTVAGNHKVLDEQGAPIVVPTNAASEVRIEENGKVRAGERIFGTLKIVDFADKTLLRKVGSNLIESLGAEQIPANASLSVGKIEGSTVEPMLTMVSMLEVSRAYQLNATLVGLADSTLDRAVNDIARIR